MGVKKSSTTPLEHLIPVGATLWSQQAPKAQPKAPPTWLLSGCFGLGGGSWTGFTGCCMATEAGRGVCEYADLVSDLARCPFSYALPGSCLRAHSELDLVTAGNTSCERAERAGTQRRNRDVRSHVPSRPVPSPPTPYPTPPGAALQPTMTAITVATLELYCRAQMSF